ncbi:hypothetical protein FDZ71_03805, partial [bacterium]
INVAAQNRPPVLYPVGNRSYPSSDIPPIPLYASDPDGDALTYDAVSMSLDGTSVNPGLNGANGVILDTSTTPPRFILTNNFLLYATNYIFAFPFTLQVTFVVSDPYGGSDSETVQVVINSSAPPDVAPEFIAVGAQSAIVGRALSFDVSAFDAGGQDVTVTCQNPPAWAAFNGRTFTGTPAVADRGTNPTVTFLATDTASNSVSMNVTVSVSAAPQLGALSNRTVAVGSNMSFTVTATDADGDAITLSADGVPTEASFNPASGAFSWTPSVSGSYPVRFTAADALASSSATIELSAHNPPSIQPIANQFTTVGSQLVFNVNVTDLDYDLETLTAQNLPSGAVLANGVFIWIPPAGEGGKNYTVTFTATDALGASDSRNVTIYVNRPPVFASESVGTAHLGLPFVFDLKVSDPDGDSVTVTTLGTLPGNMTINSSNNVLNWVPTSQDLASNPYNLSFRADDGVGGVATKTLTLIINSPPEFTSANSAVAVVDQPFAYEVTVSDPDADAVFVTPISALPAGMTFSGSTLSWTPIASQAAGAPYSVIFRAADAKGGISELTLLVDVNTPPVFTSETAKMAIVGDAFTHALSVNDPDGDAILFSTSTTLLPGMTFSGGVLSWTPAATALGQMPMNITFVADDQRGGVATQLFTLTLDRKPIFTSPSTASVKALETLSLNVTAIDDDAEAVTIT